MLGDPRTLIPDEPVNGLDPEGVQWVRRLVRSLADEGRTVFLSSHLMSERAQTADQLPVIGLGRILAAGPVQQVIDSVGITAERVGEIGCTHGLVLHELSRRSATLEAYMNLTQDAVEYRSTASASTAAVPKGTNR